MRWVLIVVVSCGLFAVCGAEDAAKVAPKPAQAPAPKPEATPLVIDLGGGLSVKLVRVPAGTFTMGSPKTERAHSKTESPLRDVTISRDFHMSRCEITRGQFAAFVKDTDFKTQAEADGWAYAWDGKKWDKVKGATWRKVGFAQADDHPVLCVTLSDAKAFCEWLGAKAGRTGRVPTEAEWEYACRAGTRTIFWWGDTLAEGKGCGNVADKTAKAKFRDWKIFPWEDGYVFTAPVGSFKPNPWGLHDMHGNVWEWCGDWRSRDYAKAGKVDPTGAEKGKYRVLRGGSWMSSPPFVRSAYRGKALPVGWHCDNMAGIRVVLETAPPKSGTSTAP